MTSILIGGDVCPMGALESVFAQGQADDIFHDLAPEICMADLSIVNLECPLITEESPILKAGPVLGARPETVQGLVRAGWKVVNLANNHSYDHGARGLRQTLEIIRGAGLRHVGAGMNLNEAGMPLITTANGQRIVIYGMAEREFSVADADSAGANPFDLINLVRSIRLHKQGGVFVVLVHGGKEYYPYPTPEMAKRCRFMIEMGADAVVCCHTHCPLPWEIYAGRPIVYGLGNLIFGASRQQPRPWHEGYLARLTIEQGRVGLETIPYIQCLDGLAARKMDPASSNRFASEMRERCASVQDDRVLRDRWLEHCREQRQAYLSELFAYNRVMHRMRRLLLRRLHSPQNVVGALHLVQCETHQEVLNTVFRDERRKKEAQLS